jgi:signal peptidase
MTGVRVFTVQVLSWTLLLAVIAAAAALIVVPKAAGARPLTVLSGSMTGTYDIGDVVVVRPVDTDDLRVGDVITFHPVPDDPALTTHRIVAFNVGSGGTRFVTRGDANNVADLSPVEPAQVRGEVWYAVPELGWVSVWMAGGWLGSLTDVVAVGLLLYGGWFLVAGLVERRRRPEEAVA